MANDVYKPEVEVVEEDVQAQVAPPRDPEPDTVPVKETSVQLDRVITDPSAPDAVQVPDEGRSPLDSDGLPINRLAEDTPEEKIAAAPDEPQDEADDSDDS